MIWDATALTWRHSNDVVGYIVCVLTYYYRIPHVHDSPKNHITSLSISYEYKNEDHVNPSRADNFLSALKYHRYLKPPHGIKKRISYTVSSMIVDDALDLMLKQVYEFKTSFYGVPHDDGYKSEYFFRTNS